LCLIGEAFVDAGRSRANSESHRSRVMLASMGRRAVRLASGGVWDLVSEIGHCVDNELQVALSEGLSETYQTEDLMQVDVAT
jgi:hypothetical protein